MYEIKKEIKELALNITEQEYRDLPILSHSIINKFEKTGYDGLEHLFDKEESSGFLLGSCVDTLLTESQDDFYRKYVVLDVNLTDSGKEICKYLLELPTPYESFEQIPEHVVSNIAKHKVEFWKADKWDSRRYREVLDTGNIADYYNTLVQGGKTIVDTDTYQAAINCVRALKESPMTGGIFACDDEMTPVRRYYQLKLKHEFEGIPYKVMFDVVIVDYEDKIVYPYDLKTMGKPEWHFPENFMKFRYDNQARLYWSVLRAAMNADEYFKDFKLSTFKFIVVNRNTLQPLVWEFPYGDMPGDLQDSEGNIYRHPIDAGKELQAYLNFKPLVPNGIKNDEKNILDILKPVVNEN